jgi:hypothetical protein
MKCNAWTLGLLSAGLVSLPAILQAEEKPSTVLTALSATTLSGYVDTSAQWNLGTGDLSVPNYTYGGPSKADGFNLNAVKISLEKPVDAADQWGAGYKVDLMAGPDANAFGNQSSGFGTGADFAVRQAYVALHAPLGNGVDFKIGVWDPIMGYEVTDAPSNPNFTRSYGYTVEPLSHTGIQASYQVNDMIAASAGIANTFGPTINQRAFLASGYVKAESYKAYMGSVTFTAPTNWGVLGGSTITGAAMSGYDSAAPSTGAGASQTSFYVGGTFNTPVTGLKAGFAYDYAGVAAKYVPVGGSGYADVIGLYVSYQLTEKLTLYGRGEYAWSGSPTAFLAKDVFEATATVQYDLWKNVLSRLEFRWDHAADASGPYGGTATSAPSKDNSYILLADIAYKF